MSLNADIALLSRLRFITHKRRRGGTWGERRSTRKGVGLEFADYRDYAPGDDPRRVDWNLYARLDRPYVRLYEEEEDLSVILLLDGSTSMGWVNNTYTTTPPEADLEGAAERGPEGRWPAVQTLAKALGAIALLGGDSLRSGVLRGTQTTSLWGPKRGRGNLTAWEQWLTAQQPGGEVDHAAALHNFASRPNRPGLVLLFTDGYEPQNLARGIATLAGRGHEVVLLHVLTPDELDPRIRGDLRLVDAETGSKREVTVDNATLTAYQQRLSEWQAELRALSGKHGGRYAMLRSDLPLRRLLLEGLRHEGVVR